MDEGNHFGGWDLWLENGRIGSHIVNKWQENAVKVVANTPLRPNEWNHVFVTYDGSGQAKMDEDFHRRHRTDQP
jgi:hypothetical protein